VARLAATRQDREFVTTVALPPIAGIPVEHRLDDFRLSRPGSVLPHWSGSRITDSPLVIRHRLGDVTVPTEGTALPAEAIRDGALGAYYMDAQNRPLVLFRAFEGLAPRQLLRTEEPGRRYELIYETTPRNPVSQWARDRAIFSLAVAARGGLVVHACGFRLPGGGGVIAPGVSGAGKSTLARVLARSGRGVDVLSDDRVVVSALEGETSQRLWGTPWWSRARAAHPGDAPLRALVLIKWGRGAQLRELSRRDAYKRLLTCLALPAWSRPVAELVLERVARLVETVRALELEYEPTVASARCIVDALETIANGRDD
jgi:hypothetical protein